MKIAWSTDTHLDCAFPVMVSEWLTSILALSPDIVLLTGDISNGEAVLHSLRGIQKALNLPVYFVLGNHDLWMSSRDIVHRRVACLSPSLHWLSRSGVVELTPQTALVGSDGWYDGRAGDFYGSGFRMVDFNAIKDFSGIGKDCSFSMMQRWADESTAYILQNAKEAASKYPNVVIATHVPPVPRACVHRGKSTDVGILPFYCNRRLGEGLVDLASGYPETKFTVLCGHTHGGITYSPIPNLTCMVGAAEYRAPSLAGILEFP